MTTAGLRTRFALAGASVVGPAHHRVGRNNQDAWAAWVGDDLAVLAVADGCSSGTASEVGAHFAARWIVAHAVQRWSRGRTGRHEELMRELFDELVQQLGLLAASLAAEPEKLADVVGDLLLATILVAIADHERVSISGVGDGLIVLDSTPIVLNSDTSAGPKYLAYRLLDSADTGHTPGSLAPRLLATASTDALRRIILATDGAHELLPPKARCDHLAALFEDGQVARRPALLEARLKKLASESDILYDDVTLVALMANRPRAADV